MEDFGGGGKGEEGACSKCLPGHQKKKLFSAALRHNG